VGLDRARARRLTDVRDARRRGARRQRCAAVVASSASCSERAGDTLEVALLVLEQLAQLESKLRQRRKSLADEATRAAARIALNVSEGRQRAGLDRPGFFRRAAGSAAELTTSLRIAKGLGFITTTEFAEIDAQLDRVRAM